MGKFAFRFKRNMFFGVLVLLLPALLATAVAVVADSQKKTPVITLCEIGRGVDVAKLNYNGAISMVSTTDKDGNYNFYPAQLQTGEWALWLMDSNFAEKEKLARYQVIRPDLQFAKMYTGGRASLYTYMDALEAGADEATLELLAENTKSWWPCWEMVRVPPSSVVFTDDMVLDDLIVYGEARLPILDAVGDTWTAENLVLNAGPYRPTGISLAGDILYVEPLSQTVPITISHGITTTAEIAYQAHSRYVTNTCTTAKRLESNQDGSFEHWGWSACGDEWVTAVAAELPLAIDAGRVVVTGTATITPTIDTAVWPVRSVTCSLLSVSAGAMYCTAVGDGDLVTVTVYDSAFAVAAVPVEVSWVSVSEK